jgi:hypothetical protein
LFDRHTEGTSELSFGVSTLRSAFWQELAQRFTRIRQDSLNQSRRVIDASYHPRGWGFEAFPSFRNATSGQWYLSPERPILIDEFKSTAALCAVALGAPNTDSSWAEWLDCLRREVLSFDADHMRSDSWEQERRPEPDFEVVVKGLLWPPLEIRPNPDPQLVETQIGDIGDVCAASERVCRRLADEALKIELTRASLEAASSTTPFATVDAIPESARHHFQAIPASVRRPTTQPVARTQASAPERATADTSRAMTLREAAKALRLSEDTLHRMRKRGDIKMVKIASRWRVLASEVIRLREEI